MSRYSASVRNFSLTQVAFGPLIGLDRLNETDRGRPNAACCRSWIIVICSYNLQAILSMLAPAGLSRTGPARLA